MSSGRIAGRDDDMATYRDAESYDLIHTDDPNVAPSVEVRLNTLITAAREIRMTLNVMDSSATKAAPEPGGVPPMFPIEMALDELHGFLHGILEKSQALSARIGRLE